MPNLLKSAKRILVLDGNAEKRLPGSVGTSLMPLCSNSVYSMFVRQYSNPCSNFGLDHDIHAFRGIEQSGQDANPKDLFSSHPIPESIKRPLSVPATGLLIWRMRTSFYFVFQTNRILRLPKRVSKAIHARRASMSGAMGHCVDQLPSTVKTGTKGCVKSMKLSLGLPNH